jgi:hypothetical protein
MYWTIGVPAFNLRAGTLTGVPLAAAGDERQERGAASISLLLAVCTRRLGLKRVRERPAVTHRGLRAAKGSL